MKDSTATSSRVSSKSSSYIFGQYGHFRIQLHRWFAVCIFLAKDASQPAQRQSIMVLGDHIFSDLRDDHDVLFADCLQSFGLPTGALYVGSPSPATPIWISLHAELEVDHALDALRPILCDPAFGTAAPEVFHAAAGRAFGGHADYLDSLLEEHARS